ncbi:S1/P1 nuclease [Mucilaginibacter sp. RB4R14]|uniref:S1/P1 nuclease n=1 Tax=Mucilaginibacter aurantiaciroseus TaxID=2949308 RepID=UPI002090E814|nr:S1/P1 nuclease [Mucilaginibacter aurantiaciroseus]MCO5935539.1 S1/P1 nuclease [Mucilaginibacter aurantiaciroseus]
MKTSIFKKIILGIAIIYLPVQAMAWGTNGHRISGQIADSYLNAKARAAIKAILGTESLAITSNWADFIKSDPQYNYLYNWHFINMEREYSYPEMQEFLKKDTLTDAYTKINFLVGELKKKNLAKNNKRLALRMLIHIIEDIHQPMHTGHLSDKGGNDVKLKWFDKDTNLHSIWDSQLIDFQQLSYTEYVSWINHPTVAQIKDWQKSPVSQWLLESNHLAAKIYAGVKDTDKINVYKYNFEYIGTLNDQLVKGGVRVAALLNQIFG